MIKFKNAEKTSISFSETNAAGEEVEIFGLQFEMDGDQITITSSGDVADRAKAWLAAGNTPSDFVADPDDIKRAINSERDARVASGFIFDPGGGMKLFQSDEEAMANFAGAGTLALAAIVAGKQPGDYRWQDDDNDFEWLASDNTYVKLDAQSTLALATAAAEWKKGHIMAARALKDMDPLPSKAVYEDDQNWP